MAKPGDWHQTTGGPDIGAEPGSASSAWIARLTVAHHITQVYANCLDGQAEPANHRIDTALGDTLNEQDGQGQITASDLR